MRSEWKETTLGKVVNFRRGHDLPISRMVNGNIPVVGSNGVIGHHNVSTTPAPCITIGRSGNVGKPYLSQVDSWAHNTTLYIDDFKGNDPQFVFYFLKTLDLESFRGGSAVPTLNRNHIHPIEVIIPPLSEQKAIAHILGSLDDKIELNRQMNATLEGMAQALFKSWFVDFDPVIDNALAAGNPIPDELADRAEFRRQALSNDTANRKAAKHFPSNFQQTESMGWIPEGWEVKQVKDFGYVVCGKTPSKSNPDYYGDDVHFIKIPDMHDSVWITNTNDGLSFAGARSQAKKHIPAKSISVSCIATVGKVVITSQPSHTNQQINSLIPHRGESRYYLYFAFLGKNKELHDLASGGSATLNLNTGIFSKIEILSPSQEALSDYHDVIDPLFEKMLASDLESQSLTKLRDTLLPKLISGELQIQEAE
jgi:type I restriction enzyme S subunit